MCKYSEGEMSKLSVSLRFSVFSRWQLDRWKIGNFRERPLYSLFLSLPLSFRFRRILWNFHRRGSSRNASYLILPINGTFDIFARFNRTTCVNESGNGNERKRLALSGKAGNEIINWNYEGGVGGWLKPNDSNFISSVYNLYPTGSRNWGVSVLISWNKLPRLPAGKELLVRPANRTIPFLLSVFTSISLWYEIVCSTDLIAFTLIVTEGCNEHSSNYTITYISLKDIIKDRDNSKTDLTRIYVYRDAHMIHTEYICTLMEAITRQFSGDAVSRYSFRVLVNDRKAIDETLNQMATFTRYAAHDTCITIRVSSRETGLKSKISNVMQAVQYSNSLQVRQVNSTNNCANINHAATKFRTHIWYHAAPNSVEKASYNFQVSST